MFNSASSEQILKDMVFCSITGQIFLDPVVVDSGQIYEREAIQKHFITCYQGNKPWTCPKTNLIISDKMIPSIICRQMVENYLKNYPEQKNQQYVVLETGVSFSLTRLNLFKRYSYQEVFQLPTYVAILTNSIVDETLIDLALYSEEIQFEAKKSFFSTLIRHSQSTSEGFVKYDNNSFIIRDIPEMGSVVNLSSKKFANLNAVFLFVHSEESLNEIMFRINSPQSIQICKIEINPDMQRIILTSAHQNIELQAIELKLDETSSLLSSLLICLRQYILNFNANLQTSRVGCLLS